MFQVHRWTMIKYDQSAVQKEVDLRKHLRNSPPTKVAVAQGSKSIVPKGHGVSCSVLR